MLPTTPEQKTNVLEWLSNLKVLDEYCANLSRCDNVKDSKISGMKTHDCHVFLERLLPPTVYDILPKQVFDPLIELSIFFKELYVKMLKENELD